MLHLFVNFTPDRRLIDTHCFTGTGIPVTSMNYYIADQLLANQMAQLQL
jgi:hypothetical protein